MYNIVWETQHIVKTILCEQNMKDKFGMDYLNI